MGGACNVTWQLPGRHVRGRVRNHTLSVSVSMLGCHPSSIYTGIVNDIECHGSPAHPYTSHLTHTLTHTYWYGHYLLRSIILLYTQVSLVPSPSPFFFLKCGEGLGTRLHTSMIYKTLASYACDLDCSSECPLGWLRLAHCEKTLDHVELVHNLGLRGHKSSPITV